MFNYSLALFKKRNEKANKIMNNTTYSFTRTQNKKDIPKLSLFECPSIDYEFKYTKVNNKNSISTLNSFSKNTSTKKNSDIKVNNRILHSLKHSDQNIKKKSDNDSFNILTFNNETCKETNHNLKGKKISLGKYSLPLRSKLNNSLFEKNNNNENNLYSFEGSFHNKIIYKKGDFFAAKIEKDLRDILNKNKSNNNKNSNTNNNSYPKKLINNNANFSPLVKYQNNSRIKYLGYLGDSFLKKNKMKLIKKSTNDKILMELMNKNTKINSINQSIKPKMIAREILYIDQNNKTINQNKALNLLNEEKFIIKDYLSKFGDYRNNFYYNKGIGANLPLLNQKACNTDPQFNYDTKLSFDPTVKLITELGKNKLDDNIDNYKNSHLSTSGGGKLGRLIKDRFTMSNYRNINFSRMKNDSYAFNSGSHVSQFDPYDPNDNYDHYDHYDNNYKKNERTNENPNLIHSHYHHHIKNLIYKSPLRKKKKKKKEEEKLNEEISRNNDNLLKDILCLINSKVITSSIPKKHKKKKARRFSCLENAIGNLNLANKFFGGNLINNSFNTQFKIKGSDKKLIKVTFKKRRNSVLVPINEKGEEIKDRRIINKLMKEAKAKLNDDAHAQSKTFHKKLSFDSKEHFINPLDGEYEKSSEDSSSSEFSNNNSNSNNNLEINKNNNEEKEKNEKNKKNGKKKK